MNAPLPHKVLQEQTRLGQVSRDDDLFEICRQQAARLRITYGTLDRYCDFTDQYWSKKLASCGYSTSGKRPAKRGWSAEAFQAALDAFCFDLVAVHNPAKEAKLRAWMAKKLEREADIHSPLLSVGRHPAIIIKLSRRHMKKLGRQGGIARKKKLPKWKLSAIGRKGAKARWRKPIVVEITDSPIGQAILAQEKKDA